MKVCEPAAWTSVTTMGVEPEQAAKRTRDGGGDVDTIAYLFPQQTRLLELVTTPTAHCQSSAPCSKPPRRLACRRRNRCYGPDQSSSA